MINLRGVGVDSHHVLERETCARLGLKQVDIINLGSREVPTREQVLGAKAMFDAIEYPAIVHCKSGADRAGVMSAFYMHFRQQQPISEAMQQLSFKFGHVRAGMTGVLRYPFEKYVREIEPLGISYEDWVKSDAYDPAAIKREFHAGWWGTLLTDRLLRREQRCGSVRVVAVDLRVEQAVGVDDEIAHQGVVHRGLRLGLPGPHRPRRSSGRRRRNRPSSSCETR